jgi:hypothetical protein
MSNTNPANKSEPAFKISDFAKKNWLWFPICIHLQK